jgi:serine protease AprX
VACGALLGDTSARGDAGKVGAAVLQATAGGRTAPILVYLREQADLSAANGMRDEDARGWFVYHALRRVASRAQAPIVRLLRDRGIPYRSFWVADVIATRGGRPLVDTLAARSDVKAIESNVAARGLLGSESSGTGPVQAAATATVEPGVALVNAPQLWAKGFTGQGMVVGNQDTGMRWTHAALEPHYRGWNGSSADHDYNWWDAIHSAPGNPCGADTTSPCDDQGHGTHTTGTAIGYDGGTNHVGVAPGAKWIGCRNMDRGTGSPSTYTECFQFFIAPTDLSGVNRDPTRRPDVVNDSWYCPPSEGCAVDTLKTVVANTQAAGIFVVASAGNDGPSCSTVQYPPALYGASFSVGAMNASKQLADFSSRGPVTADGSGRLKPEIVAPGVAVRSATNSGDDSYAVLSGTSMAGPHVVGAVALLWSARPALIRDIARTKQLLTSTARPDVTVPTNGTGCGGSATVPNDHFGWGRLDVLAAYDASRDGAGKLAASPTAVSASAAERTVVLTYKAALGGMTDGALTIVVPSGWSAPSTAPAARGYTTSTAGAVSVSNRVVTVSHLTLASGQAVTVTYGSKAGGGPGATVTSSPGTVVWQARQKASAGGSLTNLALSPSITVYARDGSGTLTPSPASVAHGSTGNTITFTYTAASGGLFRGTLTLTVPSGWNAPSTAGSAPGYTTSGSGVLSVSQRTVTVDKLTLVAGQTVSIVYGSRAGGGPGASAPSAPGAQTWKAKERSTAGGALTALIAGSPVISIT